MNILVMRWPGTNSARGRRARMLPAAATRFTSVAPVSAAKRQNDDAENLRMSTRQPPQARAPPTEYISALIWNSGITHITRSSGCSCSRPTKASAVST
ncbi:hypothetical protein D9M70_266760 [compost metagenome]